MKIAISRMIPLALSLAAMDPAAAGQSEAADRLMRIGTVHAATLAEAMRRQDWSARRIEGAGPFHAPGAAEPLVAALGDERPVVRRLALWGLSELRAASAQHEAARLLADPTAEVRGEAARALGDMNASGYSGRIAALLKDPTSAVRLQAAHALGDLQDPTTRPGLEAALRDPAGPVRAKASWALARLREAERLLRRHAGR